MMNETVKNAVNAHMDNILKCEKRGLITYTEMAGQFCGYIKALIDLNLISEEERAECYKDFYQK